MTPQKHRARKSWSRNELCIHRLKRKSLCFVLDSVRLLAIIPFLFSPIQSKAETIIVPVPSPYSYESTSLKRLFLRGTRWRYIGFTGHTTIQLPARPARFDAGKPGTIRCGRTSCWRDGYEEPSFIGGEAERSIRKFFDYQLDCVDKTFNRVGDAAVPGDFPKGWQSVNADPTALAVATKWCPRIDDLEIGSY